MTKPKSARYLARILRKPKDPMMELIRENKDLREQLRRQREARIRLEEILAGERAAFQAYRQRLGQFNGVRS